jgi:hypothetical protein
MAVISPGEPLSSAIGFLVPELEPLVAFWRNQHDPSFEQGVSAHVTLLVPFRPAALITTELISDLVSFFAEQRLPPLEFGGVCAFRNALYLPPEPQSAIRDIIERLVERYPDTLPYGGAVPLAQIVPHVTVAQPKNPEDLVSISEAFCRASVGQLPIHARVREALLLVQDEARIYRTQAVLPFRA